MSLLDLARHHAATLTSLGLQATPDGLSLHAARAVDYKGIKTEVDDDATLDVEGEPERAPELAAAGAAETWLKGLRDVLARRLEASLAKAETAIRLLADTVLRPEELRWLGGEEAVRRRYLSFPSQSLTAAEATASATRRQKDAVATAGKARLDAVTQRLRQRRTASLRGRALHRRYDETFLFLGGDLPLELNLEKSLANAELDRLVDAPDEGLDQAVDQVLAKAREALRAKVKDQVDELARKVKGLPHIELLSDHEIIETVTPYYGGLSQSLKKRRARTALVAVEERAREAKYQDDVAKLQEQKDAYADVASYYPLARGLKRKLVLFVGPTNSDKTWRALNALTL